MKKEESNGTSGLSSKLSGSAQLVSELQLIFAIYAEDLKVFRQTGATKDDEGESKFKLLHDADMFDMVVKLLNVSDKIKKLDGVEGEGGDDKPKKSGSPRNIQDLILNND